jgi:hypothetical protein
MEYDFAGTEIDESLRGVLGRPHASHSACFCLIPEERVHMGQTGANRFHAPERPAPGIGGDIQGRCGLVTMRLPENSSGRSADEIGGPPEARAVHVVCGF